MRYLLDNSDGETVIAVPQDDDTQYETLIAETYTDEQGISKPKYSQVGRANATLPTANAGDVKSLTLVSGTAQLETTGRKSKVYVQITGGSSGTVKVDIGPTSAVAKTLVAATAANAAASQVLTIDLPANWYIKVTVVTATIAAAVQQSV